MVEEAVQVARDQGPEAISVRELARRLGVSHNAAYRHFAHRNDLMTAVAGYAYGELVGTMQRRLNDVEAADPVLRARLRLAAIGRAYVEFALSQPGLFRVASTAGSVTGPDQAPDHVQDHEADPGPYAVLAQVLDELVDVGFLAAEARPGAEATCWSTLHGFSVLNIDGPLAGMDRDERAATLDIVLASLDRSYAATTGATVDPSDIASAR